MRSNKVLLSNTYNSAKFILLSHFGQTSKPCISEVRASRGRLPRGLAIFEKLNVFIADFFNCLFFFQIAQSQNRVYLNAGSLMLNINEDDYDKGIKTLRMPAKEPKITPIVPEDENPMNLRED